MWINSLGLNDVYTNNLYEDIKSGLLLVKVIDKIIPGKIEWKKIDQNSNNKFKKIVNCGEAIDACKKAGLSIVGISGTDIHEGNRKLVLAVVWQLMRKDTLKVVGDKTEDDILKWANEITGVEPKISSFKDKSLRDSVFFIKIMSAIEKRAINWDLVYLGINVN